MYYDQAEFDIRCEWGERGVAALGPISDVVVIVDVLSFSTCVDIAAGRACYVYPHTFRDRSALSLASELNALIVGGQGGAYRLSPGDMMSVSIGSRLVMPSPNGAALTLAARPAVTLAGCLRNARATAAAAGRIGRRVAVIPAGERWGYDAPGELPLRPAVEDLIGAGAIIRYLSGRLSPEAEIALAAFRAVAGRLPDVLRACSSGREQIEKGNEADLALAAQLNASDFAAQFIEGAYVAAPGEAP